MDIVSFKRLLPLMITIAICLGGAWLLFFLLAKAVRHWGKERAADESPAAVQVWIERLTGLLKKTIAVIALLVSLLVLLHGLGVQGLPRLTWTSMLEWSRVHVLPVLFILGSGYVLIQFVSLVLGRLPALIVSSHGTLAEQAEHRKRAESVSRLVRWFCTALIVLVTGLLLIRKLGVDLAPLLAGGTLVGAALGFGAQNLIKDVIAGFFLIVENQIRVGDVAEVNGKSGVVEQLHIRTIVLRGFDGTVYIVPNGTIKYVSNFTKDFSYYVIDIGVSYQQNTDEAVAVLEDVGDKMLTDEAFKSKILAPIEVVGVDDFAPSVVMIKLRIKTVPRQQWTVGRELRRRIKIAFDEHGIDMPAPQLVISAGTGFRQVPVNGRSDSNQSTAT